MVGLLRKFSAVAQAVRSLDADFVHAVSAFDALALSCLFFIMQFLPLPKWLTIGYQQCAQLLHVSQFKSLTALMLTQLRRFGLLLRFVILYSSLLPRVTASSSARHV